MGSKEATHPFHVTTEDAVRALYERYKMNPLAKGPEHWTVSALVALGWTHDKAENAVESMLHKYFPEH